MSVKQYKWYQPTKPKRLREKTTGNKIFECIFGRLKSRWRSY
jgi:hypothetical protein